MTKEQALNKLLELYKHTMGFDDDTRNFEEVAEYINYINDDKKLLGLLEDYEKFLYRVVNALSVTELAKLCGISSRHCHRLLKTNSRLHLFKEYQYKNM